MYTFVHHVFTYTPYTVYTVYTKHICSYVFKSFILSTEFLRIGFQTEPNFQAWDGLGQPRFDWSPLLKNGVSHGVRTNPLEIIGRWDMIVILYPKILKMFKLIHIAMSLVS